MQIVDLYGDKAVIVGKEDCAAFCARVPTAKRRLAVAGMFNTGTNLLDTQMQKNIRIMPGGTGTSLWQVPWGKHRTADVKWSHTAATMEKIDKNDVLPVVIIRDPFSWLQSMCAHPYAASWRHGSHHCPNLVASDSDRKHFRKFVKDQKNIFPVTVKFDKQSQYHYTSLVHLWSEWYAQYLEVDYPILIGTCWNHLLSGGVYHNELFHCRRSFITYFSNTNNMSDFSKVRYEE